MICSNYVTGIISSTENRILASFPKIRDNNGNFNNAFGSEFTTWLNDSIGFRNTFFEIKYYIDLTFFRITYPGEKIGKDNWLFLLPADNVRKAQNNNLYTYEQMAYFVKRLSAITSYYAVKNIEFCMMAFPHKIELYSDYLPDTIIKINKQSLIEQAKEYLENNPYFDFQAPIQPFLDAKKRMLIYSKAADNAHWNNYGAFIGYTLLMSQVKKHIDEIRILTTYDFNIISFKRDTYRAGKIFTNETDYEFELRKPAQVISSKSYLFDIGFQSVDMYKSYNYFSNVDDSLPRAIIIGDSYIWMFMLPWLAESFSEMVFINYTDINQLPKLIDKIKPDIVISTGLTGSVLSSAYININPYTG